MDPQFYAVRWLTTLFAREFPLSDTFRIWDALLADPARFMFMYCVGAAMIEYVEEPLLQADFAGIMQLLQQYQPPPADELIEAADGIRQKVLRPAEEKKGKDLKQIGAELAGEMSDQVKKGWSMMKTKGLPFLTKIAQETKTKVVTIGESVNQKLKEKKGEDEEEKEEKKKKEKKSLKKEKKSLKKSSETKEEESEEEEEKEKKEESEEAEDDEVAYL